MNRRDACRLISAGGAGLALSACGASQSPTTPAPVAAQLIQPTGKYRFEVIVMEDNITVRDALTAAGLALDAPVKATWSLTSGNKFAGSLIAGIKGPRDEKMITGHWRVDLSGNYACLDINSQRVKAGTRVQCFLDDGSQVIGACVAS